MQTLKELIGEEFNSIKDEASNNKAQSLKILLGKGMNK